MRAGVLVALVCVVLCLQASQAASRFTDAEYETGFSDWMRTHTKSYSAAEWAPRFEVFKSNMDFVEAHNKRSDVTFSVGLNSFADLTAAEFSALVLQKPVSARDRARDLQGAQEFTGEGARIPRASVDWRTKGAVTAVKNQGSCGSCWTFGAAGAMESALQIAGGNLTALSEQNLLDCVANQLGCNGGSYVAAFQYVIGNGGIDTMASYPYEGVAKTCRYTTANAGAAIAAWHMVTANNESALLAAVTNQPVTVGIQANLTSFQLYKNGTYSDPNCTAASIDHAVIAVGYSTDATGDYWIIKNSWGTGWGQQGYVNMKRGVNMCGIAAQAAFPSQASKPPTGSATSASGSATSASTTGSATSASTTGTTGSATTGSTTGGGRTGVVYDDALKSGWQVAYSGNVSSISTTAAGQSGYAVSAYVGANSYLVFASSPALSTTSYSSFSFSVATSSAVSIGYGFGLVVPTQSTASSTTWKSVVAPLSTLGSPSSVSYIIFGPGPVTLSLDNIKFT